MKISTLSSLRGNHRQAFSDTDSDTPNFYHHLGRADRTKPRQLHSPRPREPQNLRRLPPPSKTPERPCQRHRILPPHFNPLRAPTVRASLRRWKAGDGDGDGDRALELEWEVPLEEGYKWPFWKSNVRVVARELQSPFDIGDIVVEGVACAAKEAREYCSRGLHGQA